MRIAIVAQPWDKIEVPFKEGSTISIVTQNISASLPDSYETFLLAGKRRKESFCEKTEHGVSVVRFGSPGERVYQLLDRVTGCFDLDPPFFSSRWYYRSYQTRIARFLEKISADVILMFTIFQCAPLLRKRLPHAKILLRTGGDAIGMLKPHIATPYLQHVDHIVGVSKHTTRRLQANYPALSDKCFTMYNGINTDQFSPRSSNSLSNPKVILFVGRVSPEKGVHVLVSAFLKVLDEHPDCELHIVGEARLLPYSFHVGLASDPLDRSLSRFYGQTLTEKIHRQVLNKNMSYLQDLDKLLDQRSRSRVKFLGPLPYVELPDIYTRASVLAAPSVIQEPFGNPVAESMACGLPVVATRGGFFSELIDDGRSGLLVVRNDVDSLASALLRVLSNSELAAELGGAARRRIVENFTWKKSIDTLLSYL